MKQESIKEFQIVGAAVKKVPNPQWCLHLASRGGELLPQAIKKKNKQTNKDFHWALSRQSFPSSSCVLSGGNAR